MSKPIVPMSIYMPHVDVSYTFEAIAHQFEMVFEIGKVERIEAVPKVNQTDGHMYHACFIYFSKWGNSYNAQYVMNNMMQGKQTNMYYLINRYWKLCPNTSEVASMPMPKHLTLVLSVPNEYYSKNSDNITNHDIAQVMELFEFGKVNPYAVKKLTYQYTWTENYPRLAEDVMEEVVHDYTMLEVNFNYWYHSKNANDVQVELEENGFIVLEPNLPDYPDMKWMGMIYHDSEIKTGINPYIWYSDPSKYQTQNKHTYINQ